MNEMNHSVLRVAMDSSINRTIYSAGFEQDMSSDITFDINDSPRMIHLIGSNLVKKEGGFFRILGDITIVVGDLMMRKGDLFKIEMEVSDTEWSYRLGPVGEIILIRGVADTRGVLPNYSLSGSTVTLQNGLFFIDGLPVTGKKTTLDLANLAAIRVNEAGMFEGVRSLPSTNVVAFVKNGQIAQLISHPDDALYDDHGILKSGFPPLPKEFDIIPEKIGLTRIGDTYHTSYDVRSKKAGGLTYYVDIANGSDTAGDGSLLKPFQRINKAISATPPARTIMIAGGIYTRDYTWSTSIVNRDLDFIGYNGTPKLTGILENPVWTEVGGGVYTMTRSLANNVIDYKKLDVNGHPQVMKKVLSLADCTANPGSYFTDGSKAYVHLSDGRSPDSDAKVIMELTNGRVQDNSNVYMENLSFSDSFRGFHAEVSTAGKRCTIYAYNVRFGVTCTLNAYNGRGANSVMQKCIAEYGMQDAFNYHKDVLIPSINVIPWFIEIDCIGRWSGFDMLPNNNGSTAHDGVIGIRVRGEYYGTYGRVVHDVHDGTRTACFGCYSHDSSRDSTIGATCFTAGQGTDTSGVCKLYLYGCKISGKNVLISKDGLSQVYLFDTPYGPTPQSGVYDPYLFMQRR